MMHDGMSVRRGSSVFDRTQQLLHAGNASQGNASARGYDSTYATERAALDLSMEDAPCVANPAGCPAGRQYLVNNNTVDVVGFLAFPNAGSTWLGLLFESATNISREANATYAEGGTTTPYGSQVKNHGDSDRPSVHPASGSQARPVKDHNVLSWPHYTRIVAVLRDPLEDVHSTYTFTKNYYPAHLEGVSVSEYYTGMAHDVAQWRCHLASATVPTLIVRYEELLSQPAAQLRRVVDFTGYGAVSDADLARAVDENPVEPHADFDLAATFPNGTLDREMLTAMGSAPMPPQACGSFVSVWRTTVGA